MKVGLLLHPDVRKLLEVQKVDQKIAHVRRDLDSLPAEKAKRDKALDELRSFHAESSGDLQTAEVGSRSNEASIKQADGELKKLEERLNTVKNNAEYQATLLQMESIRKERGRLEEEGLALIDKIETLGVTVEESKTALAAEEVVFKEFTAKAEELSRERQKQVAVIAKGRAELLTEIPPDLLEKYSRLFEARAALAVSPVEDHTCTGCYSSIPPNLQVKLQAGSAVVQCSSCQRILYLPE